MATLSFPGDFLASARSSLTDFAGTEGWTTSASGIDAISVMAAKSVITVKPEFLFAKPAVVNATHHAPFAIRSERRTAIQQALRLAGHAKLLPYNLIRRSRSAFRITETELKLMAAPAIIGLRRMPKNG